MKFVSYDFVNKKESFLRKVTIEMTLKMIVNYFLYYNSYFAQNILSV